MCRLLLQNRSLLFRALMQADLVLKQTPIRTIVLITQAPMTEFPQSWNCCNVLACCFCSWKFVTVKNRSPIVGILQFWAELVLKRHAICEAIYFLKEGHITILNTFYDLTIQCPSLFSAYKVRLAEDARFNLISFPCVHSLFVWSGVERSETTCNQQGHIFS